MADRRRPTAALLAAVVLTAVTACSPDATPRSDPDRTRMSTGTTAQKSGTGEERTDLEPLTTRFAALGDPVDATWYSGTLGSGDAPGPTSYWIDAVVTVAPATMDQLVAEHDPAAATGTPDVVEGLRPALPSAGLVTSTALDEAFSSSGFAATVWLDVEGDQVVLTARGEGS